MFSLDNVLLYMYKAAGAVLQRKFQEYINVVSIFLPWCE